MNLVMPETVASAGLSTWSTPAGSTLAD